MLPDGILPVEKEYWEKQGWLGKERPWRKTVHI